MKDDLNGTLSHYLANMGCEVPEIKMTMVPRKEEKFWFPFFLGLVKTIVLWKK